MKPAVVVDTNVPIVANGAAHQAGKCCVIACIEALLESRESGRLLLDEGGEILEEYRQHLCPSGQPGPGDAFFKWVWQNQANSDRCERVRIKPNPSRGYAEFPTDPDLRTFDRDDRKFVAVALASRRSPKVLNASDTDWWEHRVALRKNRVNVHFLCPELMETRRGSS